MNITPENLVGDPVRDEITLRFTREALAAFLNTLDAADIRCLDRPEWRLTFGLSQPFPGEGYLTETITEVSPA